MITSQSLLLRWTRFASNHHGTGPEKRSAQIRDLVTAAGFGVSDMQPPTHTPRLRTMIAGLKARWSLGSHCSVDRAGAGLLGYRSVFYRHALKSHAGPRVLLWETTYDSLLPKLAREYGYGIVALPHNLESLVCERVFNDPCYDPTSDLGAEVQRLARADRIFTISREERWFLEARGLMPNYLPFFPAGSLYTECVGIRAKRIETANSDGGVHGSLLLMGSAFNPATARGMRQQLEWLRERSSPDIQTVVVGPQSETLLAEFASSRVQILGGIPRAQLVDLLTTCSALLIHTQGGAGAVTRIPEALLAGIPVIANSNAARGQQGTPGVYVYETQSDFIALTSKPPPVPSLPPIPEASYRYLQNTISELAKAHPPLTDA